MKKLIIYVHGKNGSASEAEHYKPLLPDHDVVGLEYNSADPWSAEKEFPSSFDSLAAGYDEVNIIANSIGAFLSMYGLHEKNISRAFFISPIVDMPRLISDMMKWAGVSEEELKTRKEIETSLGETLSWDYLCYVNAHPPEWNIPTCILYGDKDNLTSIETITGFSNRINAPLTIMRGGEHWFHTGEQMNFLDRWITSIIYNRLQY